MELRPLRRPRWGPRCRHDLGAVGCRADQAAVRAEQPSGQTGGRAGQGGARDQGQARRDRRRHVRRRRRVRVLRIRRADRGRRARARHAVTAWLAALIVAVGAGGGRRRPRAAGQEQGGAGDPAGARAGDREREGGCAMGEDPGTVGAPVEAAKDPEQIREEIEATRRELGDTVEALAAKADVKAHVQRAGRAHQGVAAEPGRARGGGGRGRRGLRRLAGEEAALRMGAAAGAALRSDRDSPQREPPLELLLDRAAPCRSGP